MKILDTSALKINGLTSTMVDGHLVAILNAADKVHDLNRFPLPPELGGVISIPFELDEGENPLPEIEAYAEQMGLVGFPIFLWKTPSGYWWPNSDFPQGSLPHIHCMIFARVEN